MTDAPAPSALAPEPEPDVPAGSRKRLVAIGVALLVALGLSILVSRWWRRGGPRNAVTDLAEQGAVRLADLVVDGVLGST